MADESENVIEVTGLNNLNLPAEGNVPTVIPAGGSPNGELTEEQKLAAAEKVIADKAADKAAQEAANGKGGNQEGDDAPTAEEIAAKVTELSAKPEDQRTPEEKEFLEKNKPNELDAVTAAKVELETTYGVKLDGKYENSPEGVKQLANDLAPMVAQKMLIQSLKEIPYMAEFFQHAKEGKSIETFLAKNTAPSFEAIEIKDTEGVEDEAIKSKLISNQKAILEMGYKAKGIKEKDIKGLIDLKEAAGELFEAAKETKKELSDAHKASIAVQLKQEEDRIKAENDAALETITKAKSILAKNDFAGVQIPAAEIKGFEAALFNTDKDGYTSLDHSREKLTLDQRLLIDYIIYKQFKNLGFVPKTSPKPFDFKKANEQNNERNGSRLLGVTSDKTPEFNISSFDFSTINQKQQ